MNILSKLSDTLKELMLLHCLTELLQKNLIFLYRVFHLTSAGYSCLTWKRFWNLQIILNVLWIIFWERLIIISKKNISIIQLSCKDLTIYSKQIIVLLIRSLELPEFQEAVFMNGNVVKVYPLLKTL